MKKEIPITEADRKEIEALGNALSNYKSNHMPSSKMTNKGRVLALRPLIEEMLSEGFTYDDVAKALATGGLELKASTIREYLKDSSKKKTARRKAKPASQEKHTGNEFGNSESNNNPGIQSENITRQRTSNEIPEDDFTNL
ncbi:TPA: hypothetical protein ACQYCS_004635 [Vibrio parahaemolyticus]